MILTVDIINENGEVIKPSIYSIEDNNATQFLTELMTYPIEFADLDIEKPQAPVSAKYVNAQTYLQWFQLYRPDIDATWISTYDKWLYEKKGIKPQKITKLPKDANATDDYSFQPIADLSNPHYMLIEILMEPTEDNILKDAFLAFNFNYA